MLLIQDYIQHMSSKNLSNLTLRIAEASWSNGKCKGAPTGGSGVVEDHYYTK
jgi:hypothetical protein